MESLRARLERHGLGKYADLFAEHSIGLDILADLTEADLEKLGMPMGDRRRFLKAMPSLAAAGSSGAAGREAERRQLTVVFADLVDSTRLAAELDPEDMKDVIAGYQKAVGDEVSRFGGYVAKPLGDGLLIYFGWPQAHEDDAERAVRASIAAVAAVRRLAAPNGAALAARIGIATGEVVVGDFVGAGVDEAGAVVGETPNLAARLQSAAGANAVIVAEETMKLVGRQFVFADLGEQALKGFNLPIRVWRVDGERTAATRFAAHHSSALGAFIGREHEIGMLRQRWEEACEGECQLVLIAGEAGIGKSRLVSEFLGRLDGEPAHISYQGSPLHRNTALYPVARYLQSQADFAADDTATDRWNKLAAAIPSQSPRKRLALLFLAELMSLEAPAAETAGAKPSPDEQRDAVFDVLADAARNRTESAPLLILVEDAHWLDATTQEFIERLLDRLQHCAAMLLVTHRPEFVAPWAQHANVGLLSLSRLGRRDARAIVNSLLSLGQTLPQEIAEDIVAKSDGVPLFVEELTGSALEAARATGQRNIQIPATLRDALSEKLDRLGPAKEVAQIAAAFGREFTLDLVAAVLDRSEADLQGGLDRLMAIDIVFQTSRSAQRYMFRHALIQDAAYESMLKSRRREVHARIVAVLGKRRPEMAETEPEVLAAHLTRAGETSRASECWRKAGQLALKNSAYREAIGAFNNALPLLPAQESKARADTHRVIASAYFATGDYKSTREHLDQASADAETADDQVMIAEIAMQQCHDLIGYGGSLSEAFRFGERALEIATRLDDAGLAYGARFGLGHAAWYAGNFPAVIRFLSANLPENLKDPERVRNFGTTGSLLIDSMSVLGTVLAHCGEFERAFAVQERALNIPTDNAFDISVVQFHFNRALLIKGDAARALPQLIGSVSQAAEAGLKFTLPWHRALLGYARVLSADEEAGIGVLQQALAETDALNTTYVKAMTCALLAAALVSRWPERALEAAEAGLNVARANGYRALEAELLRTKAAALAAAEPGLAEALAEEGLALARNLGLKPEEAHVLRVLGDIAAGKGEAPAAGENHDRARAIYQNLGMTYWLERTG